MLTVTMADGSTRRVWCTFGAQQIDINPFSVPGAGSLCCLMPGSGAADAVPWFHWRTSHAHALGLASARCPAFRGVSRVKEPA